MAIEAVIFDLDGVLVSTDEYHFQAWKRMAEEKGIPFERTDNDRLRGVSRMESLDIILESDDQSYTHEEKRELASRKNRYYREALMDLNESHVLPGVHALLDALDRAGISYAVGSSSKNAPLILGRTKLADRFDIVVDGNHINRSKPDPEVFLKAAEALGIAPVSCLVVEDAQAGVDAAIRAGMAVVGVGAAADAAGVSSGYPAIDCLDMKDIIS